MYYSPHLSSCSGPFPAPPGSASSSSSGDPLTFSNAFAQLTPASRAHDLGLSDPSDDRDYLRVDLFGRLDIPSGNQIEGFDNGTGKLATLFATTHQLSYNVFTSTSYVCSSLFPEDPLPGPYIPHETTYCPLSAGDIGLNFSIPLRGTYGFSSLDTQLRIVDTSVPPQELACVSFRLTPYYPSAWYYALILWVPVGLAIGYWAATWAGRFAAGWIVGRMSMGDEADDSPDDNVDAWGRRGGASRRWGTMIVSGLSGERVGISGGLLRFITPGFRDVIWHLQFCAMLGMIAISWPDFAYPVLAKSAWASLVWNTTFATGFSWDPLSPTNRSLPQGFVDQLTNPSLPLYLDPSLPNTFLNLNDTGGLPAFAAAVGLRSTDLFGTCLGLFLSIAAGIIAISTGIWIAHGLLTYVFITNTSPDHQMASTDTLGNFDKPPLVTLKTSSTFPSLTNTKPPSRRAWWRFKFKGPVGAFHWAALNGNMARLVILFHLPITIFCSYQWTQHDQASLATRILSALAFAAFSVIAPIFLLFRMWRTPTAKLYDATRTLLSLGPMYNLYAQGKQMYQGIRFLASLTSGLAVGAGQRSGTAQAVVLLAVEIAFGLITTIWQPWRPGAGMAIPTFIFTVIRIVSVVLVLLMSPAIGLSAAATSWIAYIVLGLQALAFVFFLVMLFCKILEGLIRLFGNVKFEDSTHPLDGGLFAAFGGLSLPNRRRKKVATSKRASTAGSINTQMMLDRYSSHQSLPIDDFGYNVDAPVQRGFSVVRGGKADYENPYASLPQTGRHFADLDPIIEAGPVAATLPSVNSSRPVRHQRTRSQTAIIETFPPSQGNSPGTQTIGLPESQPPSRDPSRRQSPYTALRAAPAVYEQGDVSADDDADEASGTSEPPKSKWYQRRKSKAGTEDVDSEEEERLDDEAPRKRSGDGKWFTALLPSTSRRLSQKQWDERVQDENALRKNEPADVKLDSSDSKPGDTRSFQVKRLSRASSTSARPSPSPNSSQNTPATQPTALPEQDRPIRTFVVNRQNNVAFSSRPLTQNFQQAAREAQQAPPRSFVVNRPSAKPVRYAPVKD